MAHDARDAVVGANGEAKIIVVENLLNVTVEDEAYVK